jgi:hypothetical protein
MDGEQELVGVGVGVGLLNMTFNCWYYVMSGR